MRTTLKRLDAGRYTRAPRHVGRSGIERSYEDVLHGTPGYELVEVNADGRTAARAARRIRPMPGKNLYLSIDVRLQEGRERAFDGRPGAAVAIDPRNGQVLAMVSVPSFDPNLFVNGIGQRRLHRADSTIRTSRCSIARWRAAIRPAPRSSRFWRWAVSNCGLRRPDDTVLSTGEFFIPGQTALAIATTCAAATASVNMVQAITRSVNTYFY